ncbi:hypothetical protein ZYGR_0N00860 [Zygosaccharomyces rouxii]|uniref:ZYRO0D02420p n=2 Tax=Zygosaccharomyces rouxii TaxID=4956 RepID=C5DUY5_ZYGRC|nr:uncharacterized protein ZYRO0D02420g [Zygosaccharomyces rouxii]KAH9200518.1 hypothetical protein LQ764DRAFT_95920 [Zygosaccharomyces rouxii]GAV48682.1 hypothetical protein ZYGR_0N00860 [Zygosaccharomyces rouxii]CAR27604.1 ZYRO0D02420p [Zygosaccharomyces rouxii]
MSDFKVVSRKNLYDSDASDESLPNDNDQQEVYEPPNSFEIVEVDVKKDQDPNDKTESQLQEEFDFPLFSFGNTNESAAGDDEVQEDRGRSEVPLMRISLREPSPDRIVQERPRSYYFAEYTQDDHAKFQQSAIGFDDILKESQLGAHKGWPQFRGRVLDVSENNARIEQLNIRERHCKRRRPGKQQRLARRQGATNVKQREEKEKEIKKMIKKKFHKRGGKKNKKPEFNPLKDAAAKPKFRTE